MNKHVDLTSVKELLEDDSDALVALLDDFVTAGARDLYYMQQYFEEGNLQQVSLLAHKFKSTFDILCITSTKKQLLQLEYLVEEALHAEEITRLIEQVIFVYNEAVTEVKEELDRLLAN